MEIIEIERQDFGLQTSVCQTVFDGVRGLTF
jgi:hypothetical protein